MEITGLKKTFFSNSGAVASDGALKLARVRTKKKKFVAFTHGFHRRTIGSLAVTHTPGQPRTLRTPWSPSTFVEYGNLDAVKKAVDRDTAAVIVEPIQGEAGVIIPPDSFLAGIREDL